MDDWLRLKNMKKIVLPSSSAGQRVSESLNSATSDKQRVASSKDVITIQELAQYKVQYKSFTKTLIRTIKRPPSFPYKKQGQSNVLS